MPTAVKAHALALALALLVAACSGGSQLTVTMHTDSNVTTANVQSIKLRLYRQVRADGMTPFGCSDLLMRQVDPADPTLSRQVELDVAAGTYVSQDLVDLRNNPVVLYIEAIGNGTQVLAAGCKDFQVPDKGHVAVNVDMIAVDDGDKDGSIGRFHFTDGTAALGPDCNDADVSVHPGAAEQVCEGDKNCDHQTAPCTRCPNASCGTGTCCNSTSGQCESCPMNNCSTSSACPPAQACCARATNLCVQSSAECLCAVTDECGGPPHCCISDENTNPALHSGTCADASQLQRTEWCRCESNDQCWTLFPPVAGSICCVAQRGVCDALFAGENCLP